LKILTHRAHCGHQFELWKLPHQFYLVAGMGGISNNWDYTMRPMPINSTFIDVRRVKEADYQFLIMHFDENALTPNHPNLTEDWGKCFRYLKTLNIPKVAVCHGTPQFKEQGILKDRTYPVNIYDDRRQQMVNYMSDTLVICNSHQAQREWGFVWSKVIWHGFNLLEYPASTYDRGVLTLNEKSLYQRPHYRGLSLYEEVMKKFPFATEYTKVVEPPTTSDPNHYAKQKFKNYVDTLAQYSIYFNPTIRSPMPRSRGEAMVAGLVTVNAHNHDVDLLIDNKINGFYSNDPEELADYMTYLIRNPIITRKIGLQSRLMSKLKLNYSRYLSEWRATIKEVIG